jgi:hypothetical protein
VATHLITGTRRGWRIYGKTIGRINGRARLLLSCTAHARQADRIRDSLRGVRRTGWLGRSSRPPGAGRADATGAGRSHIGCNGRSGTAGGCGTGRLAPRRAFFRYRAGQATLSGGGTPDESSRQTLAPTVEGAVNPGCPCRCQGQRQRENESCPPGGRCVVANGRNQGDGRGPPPPNVRWAGGLRRTHQSTGRANGPRQPPAPTATDPRRA